MVVALITLEKLVEGLNHVEVTRYAQLASAAVIVYDHLVTFDEEIDLIWGSSWSKGKILFLVNRYYSLAVVGTNNYGLFSPTLTPSLWVTTFIDPVSILTLPGPSLYSCIHFFRWQGWTGLIACMLAQLILQMRLYAMYSLNKIVLITMAVAFLGSTVTSAWVMHTALSVIEVKTINLVHGKFCMSTGIPSNFYIFWIPMLGFECLLCTLALFRGFQAFKSDGSLFRSGRALVRILIRDSVLYFLVIGATYLTCLLVWLLAPVSLLEVPIGFSVAMSCVLANRIVLNVREANRELELSKIPQGVSAALSSKMVVFPEGYFQGETFGNVGSLTEYEMDELRMMRPGAPEPEIDRSDSDSDAGHLPFTVL